MPINKTVNIFQEKYNELCQLGGGISGGPARSKAQQLLIQAGKQLNDELYNDVTSSISSFPDINPWHICFSIGVVWGHFAQNIPEFIESASTLMSNWNDDLIAEARSYNFERGPETLEHVLMGGYQMFQTVTLPKEIPDTLDKLWKVQQRWLGPIIGNKRPAYIGSWNAAAMFLVALFIHRGLWHKLKDRTVLLPPGGPIHRALRILYQDKVINRKPAGSELDDQAFEPGALYENQELMENLMPNDDDCSVVDVHSGLYMLGTKRP